MTDEKRLEPNEALELIKKAQQRLLYAVDPLPGIPQEAWKHTDEFLDRVSEILAKAGVA